MKGGFMTSFYANGELNWLYSRDPVRVDGVTCEDSLYQVIYLHMNGRLQRYVLDKVATIERVEYPSGSILHFDQAGKMLRK
jgi:hypothetical protein